MTVPGEVKLARHANDLDDDGHDTGATPTAADVSVADVGGYFTGTDVEAALQELGAEIAGTSSIYVNVATFGATGDGTTDDTSAIQDALDAIQTAGVAATLFFPRGTYKITATLQVNAQIHFLGEGSPDSPASVIHMTTANTTAINGQAPPYDMYFENLWINGPTIGGLSGASSGYGITSSRNIHSLNLRVSGFYIGVAIGSLSYYSKNINCLYVFNDYAGATIHQDANTSTFINCRSSWNGGYGYIFAGNGAGGESPKVWGGAVEHNTNIGILFNGGSLEGSFSVIGTYFEGNGEDIVLGYSQAVHGVTIQSCIFITNTAWNIDVVSGDRITIIGNRFLSGTANNVRQQAGATNVVLVNNLPGGGGTYSLQAGAINIDPADTTTPAAVGNAGSASTVAPLARASHVHALGGTVGGDLSGTLPNPSVAATHAGSTHIALSSATPLVESGSGAAGSGTAASKDDHVHPAAATGAGAVDHEHIGEITFSGDGTTTAFELPAAPFDAYSVQAFVAGVRVPITLSGAMLTTMTFGVAPASGTDNITVDIVAAAA